ncbi:MAG TPA: DUF5999 family protein [Streptosporangiaceae bacterium]|nr:DUF5999 family protein [Streptosporangiaceae bacterium]
MCEHQPPCPDATAPGHIAARVTAHHARRGWSLPCNGVVRRGRARRHRRGGPAVRAGGVPARASGLWAGLGEGQGDHR